MVIPLGLKALFTGVRTFNIGNEWQWTWDSLLVIGTTVGIGTNPDTNFIAGSGNS